MEGIVEHVQPPNGQFQHAIVSCQDGQKAYLARHEAKQAGLLGLKVGDRLSFNLQQHPRHALPNVVQPALVVAAQASYVLQSQQQPAVVQQSVHAVATQISVVYPERPDQNGWSLITIFCRDAQGNPVSGVVLLCSSRVFQVRAFNKPLEATPEVNQHTVFVGNSGEEHFFLAVPPGFSIIDVSLVGNASCLKQQLKLYQR